MSMQTVGTCGNCGGAVQVPMFWGGSIPPKPTCVDCGATAKDSHGPTLPMNPAPKDAEQTYAMYGFGKHKE